MKTKKIKAAIRGVIVAGSLTMAALAPAQKSLTASDIQTGTQTGSHPTNGTMPASIGSSSPLDANASPFPDTTRQKRNDERQRRIVSDTQKLLALTGQLKAELSNTGAETMSPLMIKQMEEIEKLAKSVKDKMRD